MVDSVSVRFNNARVEKMPLNIRIQWNAGTACVSECVLKTLACRGLRVGPSKVSELLVAMTLQGIGNLTKDTPAKNVFGTRTFSSPPTVPNHGEGEHGPW